MKYPNSKEFYKGIRKFEKCEKRDAMYKVASFLIYYFWGKPSEMADSLGVLLLTWNQAFYRYGVFDFDKLEKFIRKNLRKLKGFRKRRIISLSDSDESEIECLFNDLLDVLKIDSYSMKGKKGKKKERKSPVAVAKALHLLAPNFFPLWDNEIAKAYKCRFTKTDSAKKYIAFCKILKEMYQNVKEYIKDSKKKKVGSKIN